MRPRLFDAETQTLFIKVSTTSKLARMFTTGTEVNILHRLIIGVADANDFFTTGTSDMCTFVSEWSTLDKIGFYCREVIFCFLYYLLSSIVNSIDDPPFQVWTAIKEASRHIPWAMFQLQNYS